MDRSLIVYCALLSAFGSVQMKQTNTQRGLVVFVGQNTKMNCLLSKEFNISSWVYKAIEKTRAITTLYSVEIGLNGDVKRFEVSDNADILSIIDTQLEDAGIYICKTLCSDEEGNRVLEEVVDVVVLGGEPGCSSSPSESVVEGAKIQMQCSVLYRGNWAPVMTWRQKGPNTTVVKDGIQTRETATNHSETASSTLTLLAMRNIHKASYTCTTYLRKYVGNLHTANTTIPDYNHTWTSPELNVKYNPRDIAISPEGYSHYVGDELTCSADANPGATYEWKDLTNGRVFKGASIRLDENMTNQKITRLLCTATNNISNSTLSVNVTVNKVLINPAMIALAVVPSSVLLVILLVVAVILYLVLTKRIASGCKEAKSPAENPDPIETPRAISDPESTESNSYTSISSHEVSHEVEAEDTTIALESKSIHRKLTPQYSQLGMREIPLPVVYSRLEHKGRPVPGAAMAAAVEPRRNDYVNIKEQSVDYYNIERLISP